MSHDATLFSGRANPVLAADIARHLGVPVARCTIVPPVFAQAVKRYLEATARGLATIVESSPSSPRSLP